MKRILAIVCLLGLLCVGAAWGWMGVHVAGNVGSAVSVNTDSCTGGLLFSWHAENVDVTLGGVAGGVNNGCSTGDTTATLNNSATISSAQYSDGGNSLLCDAANRYAIFDNDNTGDVIWQRDVGTIIFDFRINTFSSGGMLFETNIDANNNYQVQMAGTSGAIDIAVFYKGQSTTASFTINSNLVVDTWYTFIGKWREGVTDPSLYGKVKNFGGADIVSNLSNTDLTAMTGTMPAGAVRIGNRSGNTITEWVDNVQIYDSYLADDPR